LNRDTYVAGDLLLAVAHRFVAVARARELTFGSSG
jgi:hypothetical protein